MNQMMQSLLPYLVGEIFETEAVQYMKQIDELINENDALLGRYSDGFNHLGRNYGRDGRAAHNCPALRLPLVTRMSMLLQIQKNMEFDKQMVKSVLTRLLGFCTTLEDARDALPENVVNLHPQLAAIGRTRPSGWPFSDKLQYAMQYKKVLDKIEIHLAARYLY